MGKINKSELEETRRRVLLLLLRVSIALEMEQSAFVSVFFVKDIYFYFYCSLFTFMCTCWVRPYLTFMHICKVHKN